MVFFTLSVLDLRKSYNCLHKSLPLFFLVFVSTIRCRCGHCNSVTLVGSLEYRCCREVTSSTAKMLFDGSIENIECIIQHEDYGAITNRAVLTQVAPLLRKKEGGNYCRRSGVSENE